jgi:hypothetical protein
VGGGPESLGSWSVDPDSLDHRFLSRSGAFDIVPRVAGEFSVLDRSAKEVLGEIGWSPKGPL